MAGWRVDHGCRWWRDCSWVRDLAGSTDRHQRARELRWKQAESARQLIDQMFHEEDSNYATIMLDSYTRTYPVPGAGDVEITWTDVLQALNVQSFAKEDPKSDFIRDCFDMLIYYLDRFEHLIQAGLITFEHVRTPIQYYVDPMAEHKAIFIPYIQFCKYKNIWRFLDRFPEWAEKRLPSSEDAAGQLKA